MAEGTLVEDTIGGQPAVFLGWLFHSERNIAERLSALSAGPLPWSGIDADRALPWVEARAGISLAPSQAAALRQALRAKVLVITGGPGVGKTTLVNSIIRILGAKGTRILLAAPTGRAAKRMNEATGLEARTLHRLLEVDPRTGGFKRSEENPLEGDLLVVDETSMVDVPLMYALLKAVPPGMALLLVGDVDQLPSVGPGTGAGRHHRQRHRAGGPADRGVPAGGEQPDHHQRPPDQHRHAAAAAGPGRNQRLPLGRRRHARTGRAARSSIWSPATCRAARGSTRSATSRCCAR